jgi:O-antigen/teichoic acid export membrane protein
VGPPRRPLYWPFARLRLATGLAGSHPVEAGGRGPKSHVARRARALTGFTQTRLWRRSATAVGLYLSVALGLLAGVVAFRLLGKHDFGLFTTVMLAAGFFESLLDLTFEESLTKYGFRYVAAKDWGRLRRLFDVALRIKLLGAAVALVALLAFAPVANSVFDARRLTTPMLLIAFLPLVQTLEDVAATALLLRGRYDVRAGFLTLSMGLRLAGVAVGANYGVVEAVLGVLAAQVVATAAIGVAGVAAFRRFPTAAPRPLQDDTREIVSFVAQSSVATGILSLRTMLAPLLLGVVAGTTAVGLFRVAQAPQSGLNAASAPVRLILLTEQTRDWEHGRERTVMRGVRRYMIGAVALMAVTVPVFYWAMPDLLRLVFGRDSLDAGNAARIILFAAALQLVFGWSKSLPVSIGRPRLRIWAHGLETIVLLPLVLVLGAEWGVTGAGVATLVSTGAFVALWSVLLLRLRGEVASRAAAPVAS